MRRINLTARRGQARQTITRNIKILAATHYAIFVENDLDEIARIVNCKPQTVLEWTEKPEWREACEFWQPNTPPIVLMRRNTHARLLQKAVRSLTRAGKLWEYMIENGLDLRSNEMGTHQDVTHLMQNTKPPRYHATGTEAITPLSRLRDFLKTLPVRLKYKAWAFYIWFTLL